MSGPGLGQLFSCSAKLTFLSLVFEYILVLTWARAAVGPGRHVLGSSDMHAAVLILRRVVSAVIVFRDNMHAYRYRT